METFTPVSGLVGGLLIGLLIGFDTLLGSGCTSGHGVCGLARLSKRPIAATATFFGVAILTGTRIDGTNALTLTVSAIK